MNVLVGLQPNTSFEALATTLMIADKYFLIIGTFLLSTLLDGLAWGIKITVETLFTINVVVVLAIVIPIADHLLM